ncbi:MAG TPA: alpha-amylase family glycosyl hydrolase [Lysobacter sp.]
MSDRRCKRFHVASAFAIAWLAVATPVVPALAKGPPAAAENAAGLHVPSPDWRDQIVYFLMLDRFDDGDPGNNDQGTGEFDPADGARFSGGDLAGVAQRVDYIKGLGATAVWITPPVANQWWNNHARYGGYHGYWARDFKAVDPHFGTLDDYRRVSRALHGAGMFLIQDVVVNHTGDYFAYPDNASRSDPAAAYQPRTDGAGHRAPARWPFSLNDARRPADRDAAIYHWTPDIRDYADRTQELTYQLAGLDDLNTDNPVVRAALRDAYGFWIREVGVDGFRVDTAFYATPEYFGDFLDAADKAHPGIRRVAAATGRDDFHVFGEGFATDKAYEDVQARKIDGYLRDAQGKALLPGMINFPLYGTLGDVFARGRPPAELGHRIGSMMAVHERPQLMPTFVDNHDVDRFLAGGSEAGLKQALLATMTLPGIPTIYYGTEQGFTAQRAAMFAKGNGAGGRDHFDTNAPLYRYLQRATALRRGNRLFSRGVPTVLAANAAAPGVLAYRMQHEGESALVAFNSADRAALLDNLDTGLAAGSVLQGMFAIEGDAPELVVGANGRVSVVLPPRAGFVWRAGDEARAVVDAGAAIALAQAPGETSGDFVLGGSAPGVKQVRVVVDGDLDAAIPVDVGRDGRWHTRVDTRDMVDAGVVHTVVAWDAERGIASPPHRFKVAREWTLLAELSDPAGDDHGPRGNYAYPIDTSWGEHRQGDLRGLRAWGSGGGALKLELQMHEVTAPWNPANGFDHVAFTVFIALPGRDDGSTLMPLQNATLPEGMRWHYRLRAHGWSNALFGAPGASATDEGRIAAPTAHIAADAARDTVTFTFPARALGNPATLSGAKLYVTTWDYDGGYRALAPRATSHAFGGGDGAVDPLVLDDMGVIVLP